MSDPINDVIRNAEEAITAGQQTLNRSGEVAISAIHVIRGEIPSGTRAALLSMETLIGNTLQQIVRLFHARGEHDRAAAMVDLSSRIQRAVTGKLAETASSGS